MSTCISFLESYTSLTFKNIFVFLLKGNSVPPYDMMVILILLICVSEVLKQVWDLSDRDNDSMLSLREFCTALYLMERYREGCPLPSVLPSSIISDETLLSTPGHPPASYRNVAWRPAQGILSLFIFILYFAFPCFHGSSPFTKTSAIGFKQPQASSAPRPPLPSARGRPPRPGPVPQTDAQPLPTQQKSKVPVLEKNLVDQLSQEEQDALNSKFKEATEANKKAFPLFLHYFLCSSG